MEEIKKFVGNGVRLFVAKALPDYAKNREIEHHVELLRKILQTENES